MSAKPRSRRANLRVDLSSLPPPAPEAPGRATGAATVAPTPFRNARASAFLPDFDVVAPSPAANVIYEAFDQRLRATLDPEVEEEESPAHRRTSRGLVPDDSLASIDGSADWSSADGGLSADVAYASLGMMSMRANASARHDEVCDTLRMHIAEHPHGGGSLWGRGDRKRRASEENLERKRKQTFVPKELVREYCEATKCEIKALAARQSPTSAKAEEDADSVDGTGAAAAGRAAPAGSATTGGRRKRNPNVTAEERARARRERNRLAAKNLRARKRELRTVLEFHEGNLTHGNEKLREEIGGLRMELQSLQRMLALHKCPKAR